MEIAILLVASALFAVAAYTDIGRRRIPNAISLALAALGLPRLMSIGDPRTALLSLGLAGAVLAVGLLLFWRGLIGGGDVKLLAASALLVGYRDLIGFLFVMSLCGALLSLGLLAATRLGQPAAFYPAKMAPAEADGTAKATVPYGVALAAAGILTLMLQFFTPR